MEESILDISLYKIKSNLLYLWNDYGFNIVFFTRDYGRYYRGFLVGLENEICKIVFRRDSNSIREPFVGYIGTKNAPFRITSTDYLHEDGWYSMSGLVYWISGVDYQFGDDVDLHLQDFSEYVKPNMDALIELFNDPKNIGEKISYYRDLYKDDQITVEKIREERARLQALGQDSSLEAALKNLRGERR